MIRVLSEHCRVSGSWGAVFVGLRRQAQVIGALMLRSAMARHGHENLGFFWIVGEPIFLTAGVMAMWSATGQGHGGEVGVIPFALTGYTYITLWRHLVGRATRALTYNASLLYLTPVKPLDILISNAILEIFAELSAFTVVYIPLALVGLAPVAHDPLLSLTGYFLLGWFGFAFSLIILGISELAESSDKFIQPIMYITLPLTGLFSMVDWLPSKAQDILMWSPLVSGIEMFRGGIFSPDVPIHYDAWYMVTWCLALTAIGLPFCEYVQRRIQV